ncbi:MAG: DUF2089 family protein [Dehalococcoidales bacterium]|nr:DUF2089 family protein [Dehalococcoidales bacterium]
MAAEWSELTKLTGGVDIIVERVRFINSKIAIEGEFELPPLVRLSAEDQIFIMAFIQCHGSIRDMEQMFGISYPTVKNRLNRLADSLKLVDTEPLPMKTTVLSELEEGVITVSEAIERLSK